MSDAFQHAEDGEGVRPTPEPDRVDPASALATADALEEVARLLDRHLEAWPGETAKLAAWSGPRRDQFDAEAAAFMAEAVHQPATLKALATTLRMWAEAP